MEYIIYGILGLVLGMNYKLTEIIKLLQELKDERK